MRITQTNLDIASSQIRHMAQWYGVKYLETVRVQRESGLCLIVVDTADEGRDVLRTCTTTREAYEYLRGMSDALDALRSLTTH